MKILMCFLFAILTSISLLRAQEKPKSAFFIGGYYTFLVDPVTLEFTNDTVQLQHQYLNINLQYALNQKWRVGVEYILTLTSPQEVDDPFYTVGLTLDYDVLRVERSKLHLRAGLSLSNLSWAGDYEPKRRTVVNRILGASYEFRITHTAWIYAGYYNHYPFNKIPYKYATAQPFIGVRVGI